MRFAGLRGDDARAAHRAGIASISRVMLDTCGMAGRRQGGVFDMLADVLDEGNL